MTIGDYVRKFWRYLAVFGPMMIFLGAGAYIVETLPPRAIVMATGVEGSANYAAPPASHRQAGQPRRRRRREAPHRR